MSMKRLSPAALMLFASAFTGSAGELGMKAPALDIAKWVKGDPVDVTKSNGKHVCVVEF
jgi:hypothetical protein